nr:60S acidic ribosomal protein P2A-like [Ipomoea batatas]
MEEKFDRVVAKEDWGECYGFARAFNVLVGRLGCNACPSADDLKHILSSVGADCDADRIDLLLSQVEGKDITKLIAAGREKLASVPSSGGADCLMDFVSNEFNLENKLKMLTYVVVGQLDEEAAGQTMQSTNGQSFDADGRQAEDGG